MEKKLLCKDFEVQADLDLANNLLPEICFETKKNRVRKIESTVKPRTISIEKPYQIKLIGKNPSVSRNFQQSNKLLIVNSVLPSIKKHKSFLGKPSPNRHKVQTTSNRIHSIYRFRNYLLSEFN